MSACSVPMFRFLFEKAGQTKDAVEGCLESTQVRPRRPWLACEGLQASLVCMLPVRYSSARPNVALVRTRVHEYHESCFPLGNFPVQN